MCFYNVIKACHGLSAKMKLGWLKTLKEPIVRSINRPALAIWHARNTFFNRTSRHRDHGMLLTAQEVVGRRVAD